ncbi:MAG: transglutaminase family protein [Chthoniobacterales bacterium]
MKLALRYQTAYLYERPVAFSPHELRLFPRADRFHRLRRSTLRVNGGATVRYSRDAFDNFVAICFFPEPLQELRIAFEVDLDLEKKNAFDFILENDAVEMPFKYAPELHEILAPYLKRHHAGELRVPGWSPPNDEPRGTVSALVKLNQALHENIGYERREAGAALLPNETLERGRGACRDVAVLAAEILRASGLAARLVSGYLREADEETRRAEGSLHSWTEVFLPGAGWLGMDPTNGAFCNHNWIVAAVGLTPAHITPIAGSYYHKTQIASEMTSKLELINL